MRQLDADRLLRLVGRARDVRTQQHVVQVVVRRVLQRLLVEDVERRARDLPGLQALDQRLVHDQLAARAVDDADALLHAGDRLRVDQALGLRRQPDVQREVVRAAGRCRRCRPARRYSPARRWAR